MIAPTLDFTTHVDAAGYQIRPPKKLPPPAEGQTVSEQLLTLSPADFPAAHIVGKGGKLRKIAINQYPTKAFQDFAAVKSDVDLVSFIAKYGPLTKAKRQEVLPLLDEAKQMRECMQANKGEPFLRGLDLTAYFLKDRKTGELRIYTRPSTLLEALWLQFHYSLLNGAIMRTCLSCENPFAAGGESERRLDARYCSQRCQESFNSLARSNPSLRAKRRLKEKRK